MSSATVTAPRHPQTARAETHGGLPLIEVFGSYGPAGAGRSVLALARCDGSVLVIDRDAANGEDARVVAVLAPDEPPENAVIVSEMYLSDPSRGRCRELEAEDLSGERSCDRAVEGDEHEAGNIPLLDGLGRAYAIRECPCEGPLSHLRWTRSSVREGAWAPEVLTVRDVIGALESYEPARALTVVALAPERVARGVSSVRLRSELDRLDASRLVLNRLLRETVLLAVAEGVTFSQIALRCGRTKRDQRGVLSGETSWLSRRIGLMAEAGAQAPTPWLHSDTLALIARRGLGVAPVEVEL
jgi:hypothetical protein